MIILTTFMQNKANLRKSQMDVSIIITEQKTENRRRKTEGSLHDE